MQILGILTKFFGDDAQVQGALTNGFRTILYTICTSIYKLIIFAYDLFDRISTAQILNNDAVEAIFKRVGLILGIYMLFKLTFSFIQMLIDPDSITNQDKGIGAIIKKTLIVIALMGSVNFIFKEAYTIQNIAMGKSTVNDQNMIARLLIPEQSISASGGGFGTMLSYNLLTSFYHLSDNIKSKSYSELKNNDKYKSCFDWMEDNFEEGTGSIFYYEVINNNTFETGYNCLNSTVAITDDDGTGEDQEMYLMEFDGLLAVIVGAVALWMLIMYVYSAGVRVVQLAFLQIIAPIPIMSYLSPKKYDQTMLSKWVKMCLDVYLDLFIRVAIINLVVYLITVIMSFSITDTFLETTYIDGSNSTNTTSYNYTDSFNETLNSNNSNDILMMSNNVNSLYKEEKNNDSSVNLLMMNYNIEELNDRTLYYNNSVSATTMASSNAFEETTYYSSSSSWMKIFLKVTIILALLGFANRAPDLIKELFPKSKGYKESFGIGLKEREPLGKTINATAGAVAGTAVGLTKGRPISGAIMGIKNGWNEKEMGLSGIKNTFSATTGFDSMKTSIYGKNGIRTLTGTRERKQAEREKAAKQAAQEAAEQRQANAFVNAFGNYMQENGLIHSAPTSNESTNENNTNNRNLVDNDATANYADINNLPGFGKEYDSNGEEIVRENPQYDRDIGEGGMPSAPLYDDSDNDGLPSNEEIMHNLDNDE